MRSPRDDSAQNEAEFSPLWICKVEKRSTPPRARSSSRRFSRLQYSGICGDSVSSSGYCTTELKPLVQCAVHTAPPDADGRGGRERPHNFYSRAVKFRVLIHRSLPSPSPPLPFRPSVCPSAEFINFSRESSLMKCRKRLTVRERGGGASGRAGSNRLGSGSLPFPDHVCV